MKKILLQILIIGFSTLFSTNSLAHHSFAATFSTSEKNTIEGIITNFRFINPHVLIYIDVLDNDGSVTEWTVEGSSGG